MLIQTYNHGIQITNTSTASQYCCQLGRDSITRHDGEYGDRVDKYARGFINVSTSDIINGRPILP
jgi:hypothetical protein